MIAVRLDCRTLQYQWAAHQAANKQFAEVVFQHYQEGDMVWVQDYHLMLLPALLKNRKPKMKVAPPPLPMPLLYDYIMNIPKNWDTISETSSRPKMKVGPLPVPLLYDHRIILPKKWTPSQNQSLGCRPPPPPRLTSASPRRNLSAPWSLSAALAGGGRSCRKPCNGMCNARGC